MLERLGLKCMILIHLHPGWKLHKKKWWSDEYHSLNFAGSLFQTSLKMLEVFKIGVGIGEDADGIKRR